MIKNINIQNVINFMKISKSNDPNKCIHKKIQLKSLFKCYIYNSMAPTI